MLPFHFRRVALAFGTLLVCACCAAPAAVADEPSAARDKQSLMPAQAFVGQWRGVAQPRRGSSQGAWTESYEWSWRFPAGRAELVCQLTDDKYYSQLTLQAGDKPQELVLLATLKPAGKESAPAMVRFTGQKADDAIAFTSSEASGEDPAKISFRMVADGDRMLVLYEKRTGENLYSRLAEVGSTRQGSSFAKATLGGPECVVTGGLGTIAVKYQNETYYVCCTGCRDMFQDDTAAVLKEFEARKAAEKK